MSDPTAPTAVSFDLFGTLVDVDRPADPAGAVANALESRGLSVPEDWEVAYAEPHVELPSGAELSLVDHVVSALEARGAEAPARTVEAAVRDAFEPTVRTRPGAPAVVDRLAARGPVGVLSNCSVPGLAERALARSAVDESRFNAVVTSVGCGWRKPDRRAFVAVADALGVELTALLHVGDDPATDGGANDHGASAYLLDSDSLADLPTRLEGRWA